MNGRGNNNFLCCHRGGAPFFGHPKSRLSVPFVSPLAMTRNNQSDSREKEMRRSEQRELFCAFAGLRSGAQTEKNMRGEEKGRNKYPTVALLVHWTRRRDMRGRSRRDRRVWRPAIEHPTKLFGIRFYIGTPRTFLNIDSNHEAKRNVCLFFLVA